MKRGRCWVATALCVLWLLQGVPAAAAPYVVLGPGLSTRPMAFLKRAVGKVEARIGAWDRAFEAAGLPVRRLFSGPYGSGFLRLNRKGMDLDYACVLDLGVLQWQGPEALARALRGRVVAALETVRGTNQNLPGTPGLYLYGAAEFDHMLGRLVGPDTMEALEKRLQQIEENAGGRMFFEDLKGRKVPADLLPFQVVLPANVKLHAVSHAVQYYPGMFRGLRELSIQFFFSAAIQGEVGLRYLNICPLYDRGGRPISFYDMMLTTVFLSAEEAGLYLKRVRHLEPEEVLRRHASRLYRISEKEYGRGRYLKQLKRLHQYYNMSGAAWEPGRRQRFEEGIRRWLWSPWALIASDLAEQGEMWLKTDSAMRTVFIKAGALKELAGFLVGAVDLFAPYDADLLAALRTLAECFNRGEGARPAFERLENLGERLARDAGPRPEQMRWMLELAKGKGYDHKIQLDVAIC